MSERKENKWQSSLTNPLTEEQLSEANFDDADIWIHVRCSRCGQVECCFNRTHVARHRLCVPCLVRGERNYSAWGERGTT
jgi:hypothetical protein